MAAVVKAHGGTITVDSVPGRTEFTVRLPAVRFVAVDSDDEEPDDEAV